MGARFYEWISVKISESIFFMEKSLELTMSKKQGSKLKVHKEAIERLKQKGLVEQTEDENLVLKQSKEDK